MARTVTVTTYATHNTNDYALSTEFLTLAQAKKKAKELVKQGYKEEPTDRGSDFVQPNGRLVRFSG